MLILGLVADHPEALGQLVETADVNLGVVQQFGQVRVVVHDLRLGQSVPQRESSPQRIQTQLGDVPQSRVRLDVLCVQLDGAVGPWRVDVRLLPLIPLRFADAVL